MVRCKTIVRVTVQLMLDIVIRFLFLPVNQTSTSQWVKTAAYSYNSWLLSLAAILTNER